MTTTTSPGVVSKDNTGNYFQRELNILKVLGLSVTGYKSIAYKIYSFLYLLLAVVVYSILDFFELFKHNFEEDSDIIVYDTSGFMVFAKAGAMLFNRIKLSKLLEKLQKEPFTPNPERGGRVEEDLINECVWITRLQSSSYCIVTTLCVIANFSYPLVIRLRSSDHNDWQFSYGLFTVLNVTRSPSYEISLVYQNISVATIAAIFVAADMLLAAVLAHISYQFKMVQNCVKCIVEAAREEMRKDLLGAGNVLSKVDLHPSKIPKKYLENSLKKAVRYHLAVIDIAQEVEEIFNIMFLLIFLGTLALMCILIYHGSTIGTSPRILRYVGETMCACFQVFTTCYWGEQVVHESQQVAQAVYETDFVGTDLGFQKDLAFIMRRSQNPTKLTAGKFTVVSITTFTWIMRTSYSAFMVLRNNNSE